jgi:hypothetical protein
MSGFSGLTASLGLRAEGETQKRKEQITTKDTKDAKGKL